MIRIATHNCGTGETSRRWWHKLVVPFARCQKKTVIQQFNAGARYFDFRLRKTAGGWCFAHGLWESRTSPFDVLPELDFHARINQAEVWVAFTYEGSLDERGRQEFLKLIEDYCTVYPCVKPVYVQVRKPCWETLRLWRDEVLRYCFAPINFNRGNYRWLLPIPWLWWLLDEREPEGKEWQFVDFL